MISAHLPCNVEMGSAMLDGKTRLFIGIGKSPKGAEEYHGGNEECGHCGSKWCHSLLVALDIPQYDTVLCNQGKSGDHENQTHSPEGFGIFSDGARIVNSARNGEASHDSEGGCFADSV